MKKTFFFVLMLLSLSCSKQILVADQPFSNLDLKISYAGKLTTNQVISPNNPNIQYIGRWDTTNVANYHSYWGGAYFRVLFTGTAVKLKLGSTTTNIDVFIDGTLTNIPNAKDTVDLTPMPLSNTLHKLTVVAHFQNDQIQLNQLLFNQGAVLSNAKTLNQYLEYIGDSITTGSYANNQDILAYPWQIGNILVNYDHTQISYPSATLTDGIYYPNNPLVGMIKQYFQLKTPNYYSENNPWGFKGIQPKAVIINLGTNDNNLTDSATFVKNYKNFAAQIRQILPNTKIIAIRPFHGEFAAAVKTVCDQSPIKIYYIDTQGWLIPSDYANGTHPSVAGHAKVAQKLAPLIPAILAFDDTPYYKIVNQNSGQVLDVSQGSLVNGASVIQYPWNGGTNQQWQIVSSGNQYFKLVNRKSGKVIDVTSGSQTPGTGLIQYAYNSGNNQQWQIKDLNNGTWEILNRNSGQALDVLNGSTVNGTRCIQNTESSGTLSQHWQIIKL